MTGFDGFSLQRHLGIEEVVIHASKFAVQADAAGTAMSEGPYCERPVKSTGAGDRFNAGYALGRMLDLPAEGCLLLGDSASGSNVRLGRSACLGEILHLLQSSGAKASAKGKAP